jgi:AraC-like DNA-binding protein
MSIGRQHVSHSRHAGGDARTAAWRVTALAKDYPANARVPPHRHRRGQVLYAEAGVARVATREGLWIVPPQQALWLPPGTVHDARAESVLALRTLYLDRATSARFGTRPRVLAVSGLLRELILEGVRAYGGRDAGRMRIMLPLLLAELLRAEEGGLCIPMPSDPRLAIVCRRLLRDPAGRETIEGLARVAGASSRTLARLFERELNMTFVRWRQQVRLARALSRMTAGESIKRVARDTGYASCSAFTAMFRRALGAAPTRYLRERLPGSPGGRT